MAWLKRAGKKQRQKPARGHAQQIERAKADKYTDKPPVPKPKASKLQLTPKKVKEPKPQTVSNRKFLKSKGEIGRAHV